MADKRVHVSVDIDIKWSHVPPRYRVYVGDEMFTERTWIWEGQFIQENMFIKAPRGDYVCRVVLVDEINARLKAKNWQVVDGPASVDQSGRLHIG